MGKISDYYFIRSALSTDILIRAPAANQEIFSQGRIRERSLHAPRAMDARILLPKSHSRAVMPISCQYLSPSARPRPHSMVDVRPRCRCKTKSCSPVCRRETSRRCETKRCETYRRPLPNRVVNLWGMVHWTAALWVVCDNSLPGSSD
jgi:hypothetical protein